jgi:predicted RNase H-like nuclease
MSKQARAIVPEIREVDEELRARARLRERVREVHPEVSFQAWSGAAMRFLKESRRGREERRRLVDRHFGSAAYALVLAQLRVRDRLRVQDVGDDDILDAFAALWSAERILRGASRSLPERPRTDRFGLRMEISY